MLSTVSYIIREDSVRPLLLAINGVNVPSPLLASLILQSDDAKSFSVETGIPLNKLGFLCRDLVSTELLMSVSSLKLPERIELTVAELTRLGFVNWLRV